MKFNLCCLTACLAFLFLGVASTFAANNQRAILIVTSTNDAAGNKVAIFKLNHSATLNLVNELATGGNGGASGNAGSVQFTDPFGAVINYGSNTLTRLVRENNSIQVAGTVSLASTCINPVSVALKNRHAYVLGANCAESHSWPSGIADGDVVPLTDASGAQIVSGQSWAAVTVKSGSVLQLPLSTQGALTGASSSVTLPTDANNTPLGAAFWGDLLAFDPAHSPDSFALVNRNGNVFPVQGPQPVYPSNAPCWLAKGPGNIWYSGNSPGQAISIFLTDGQGGTFYKSVPVPGVPTDITVSADNKWLAIIFTAADGSGGRVAIFSIDRYGDLSLAATSQPIGITSFNGVAISE